MVSEDGTASNVGIVANVVIGVLVGAVIIGVIVIIADHRRRVQRLRVSPETAGTGSIRTEPVDNPVHADSK